MEWTESNTIQFIELYQNQRVLWDAKHPLHYHKIKKRDAWEEIGQVIGCSGEDCKKKMNSLLSALRREKAKIKKSKKAGKGVDEVYQSAWYAFNSMKFLWDKDSSCSTTSCIQTKEEIDTTNMYEQSPATDRSLQSPSPSLQPSSPSLQHPSPTLQQPSTSLPPQSPSLPPSSPPPCKTSLKKRKKMTDDARLNKAFEILTATAASSSATDESQAFGNFVAKKLRKYSARTQSLIQNAIMGIFLNADNGSYEQGYHTYGFPINIGTLQQRNSTN